MSQSSRVDIHSTPLSKDPQRSLLNFTHIKGVIIRRKWIVMGIAGVALMISGVMAAKTKPDYQSSMQLLVSSSLYQESRENPNKTEPNFTDSNLHIDYTAQLQLMTSVNLIRRAVEILQKDDPTMTIDYLRGKPGQKSHLAVQQLQEGIGSNKVPSQVFSVSFVDKDPIKTQRVLDVLKQVYLEHNLEEQKQRLTKGLTFINEQLPKARNQVLKSENALEQFRRQYQLIDPDTQGKKLIDGITNTQEERRKIRAEFQQIQAQMVSSQEKLSKSPQQALSASRLSQSSRYQILLNEIQKIDLALAEKKVLYQDDNQEIQILRQQRQQDMGLLQEEMDRVLQSSESSQAASLNQGQFSSIDLKIAEQLVEHQTQLSGLAARDRILIDQEQQLSQTLQQYPQILSQYNRLKPEADLNRKSLEDLLQSQQALGLKIAQGGFEWKVVEDPQLGITEGSGFSMRLIMGLVVGSILGALAALVAEQLDPVIYDTDALCQCSDVAFLGNLQIEKSGLKSGLKSRSPIIDSTIPPCLQGLSLPSARRSLDRIYRNLQKERASDSVGFQQKSFVISAGTVDEDSRLITLGLALSAASQNQRVVVIDTDGQFSPLHETLHLSNQRGLTELLLEDSPLKLAQVLQPWQPQIDVITSGNTIQEGLRLVGTPRMADILTEMEQNYDVIFIHAAPILETASVNLMARFCSGIVLTTKLGMTRRPNLTETLDAIDGSSVIGIVSHNMSRRSTQRQPISTRSLDNLPTITAAYRSSTYTDR
jgi:polysaccharide biosynthesis transport protein